MSHRSLSSEEDDSFLITGCCWGRSRDLSPGSGRYRFSPLFCLDLCLSRGITLGFSSGMCLGSGEEGSLGGEAGVLSSCASGSSAGERGVSTRLGLGERGLSLLKDLLRSLSPKGLASLSPCSWTRHPSSSLGR